MNRQKCYAAGEKILKNFLLTMHDVQTQSLQSPRPGSVLGYLHHPEPAAGRRYLASISDKISSTSQVAVEYSFGINYLHRLPHKVNLSDAENLSMVKLPLRLSMSLLRRCIASSRKAVQGMSSLRD